MKKDTVERILDSAETLCATKGYNAFSYKDIAAEVGIKTASIHYHFPSKSDLVVAMMQRHRMAMLDHFRMIDGKHSNDGRARVIEFLEDVIHGTYKNGKRMCLGAMLAIDCLVLDKKIQAEVKKFFASAEHWMEQALQDANVKQAKHHAKLIMALLEGTLLLSRMSSGEERIQLLLDNANRLMR